MKPPPLRYHAPRTVAEATDILSEAGDEGKVLAGGQSLIPLLNFRLAAPGVLVDINGVDGLDRIDVGGGRVHVGAGVRQAALERHDGAHEACPLLRQALRLVAHPVVRNRGTVCGSIAHADPAGELTAVVALLGATVHLAGPGGRRRDVAGEAFFHGPLDADVQPDEIVEAVSFPALPPRAGSAFCEVARRHGDYAVCGVAATVELDGRGRLANARVGLISVGPTPVVVEISGALGNAPPAKAAWDEAALAVQAAVRPSGDLHASAAYRTHLAGVLTRRALRAAVDDARARRDRRSRS